VKLTAKEQLLEAKRLGHELSVVRRDFPEFPDAPPKFRLTCTCGYESRQMRSEKATLGTLIWHVGKVLGEADEKTSRHAAEMRRNGLVPRQSSAS
jgi:hypothetical protein